MLDQLQKDAFADRVGTKVHLTLPDSAELELTIHEVTALPQHDGQTRPPFSVLFRGPEAPVLEQAIYSLGHSDLGTMELFLVPLGPKKSGFEYEAVFT
ncbi:MAG: hypothetical protein AAF604_07005 [Acidobacteriota bacterium]